MSYYGDFSFHLLDAPDTDRTYNDALAVTHVLPTNQPSGFLNSYLDLILNHFSNEITDQLKAALALNAEEAS